MFVNVSAFQKSELGGYLDVVCHPIISIPAPHDEVQYSEVRPHNEIVSDCLCN